MSSLTDKLPSATYAEGRIAVSLPNGVSFSFPIVGNWRLEDATVDQLNNMDVDDEGIHWPDLDEDLSFEGLLNGDWGQYIRRRQRA